MAIRSSRPSGGGTPGGGGGSPSDRTQATGGESVVRISSRNQVALGARSVQRIWLPKPRRLVHLTGATTAQADQFVSLGNIPPHTIALLLNVQIVFTTGGTNITFFVGPNGFANAAGSFHNASAGTVAEAQLIAPVSNGQLEWSTAIAGTVNYDLTVNLVAVEVQ